MKKLALLLLPLTLTACESPEQMAKRRAIQEQNDYDTCVSYGLRPKSEAFGSCLLQLDIARQQSYNYYHSYPDYYYGPRFGPGIYYMRH